MNVKAKLLLIDDDEAALALLEAKLGSRYALVKTSQPEDVLRLVRESKPDLILCDIEMPGIDGGDLSAMLFGRDDTRSIPLVYLTALVSPEALRAQGGQLGGRAAVSKDSPLEDIVARIEASLGA